MPRHTFSLDSQGGFIVWTGYDGLVWQADLGENNKVVAQMLLWSVSRSQFQMHNKPIFIQRQEMWQHWVVGISVKWNVASSLHSPHKLSCVYIFSVFESIQTKDHCIKFLSIVKHSIFLSSVLSNTEAKAIEIIYMCSITVFPSYSMPIVRYVYSKLLGWT